MESTRRGAVLADVSVGNDTRPYDSSRRLQQSGDTSFKLATPRRHWGTDPDGKGKNISMDNFYRNLGTYIWGSVTRSRCVSETITGHGDGESTSLNDIT